MGHWSQDLLGELRAKSERASVEQVFREALEAAYSEVGPVTSKMAFGFNPDRTTRKAGDIPDLEWPRYRAKIAKAMVSGMERLSEERAARVNIDQLARRVNIAKRAAND